MTDHEKLVQIASSVDAKCSGFWCGECPLQKLMKKYCDGFPYPEHNMALRFAAAKKLTREARDEK